MRKIFLTMLILLATPVRAQDSFAIPEPAFFKTLPTEFPTSDLARLKAVVADNVQVFAGDTLLFSTRDAWIAYLQANAPRGPGFPAAYSISRSNHAKQPDGGIMVLEFSYPIAPKGAQVVYEVRATSRLATYYLKDEKLVRVVYGPWK